MPLGPPLSFATHLLEKGIDVGYIQKVLGHFSIKTKIRYLHVARGKLVLIESPLDSLWIKVTLTGTRDCRIAQ